MNAGWDTSDVQDWLGHRAVSSTLVCARITNKRRDDNFERMLASREIATWT
jgi:site-specific recombinase XerD